MEPLECQRRAIPVARGEMGALELVEAAFLPCIAGTLCAREQVHRTLRQQQHHHGLAVQLRHRHLLHGCPPQRSVHVISELARHSSITTISP
eukprot:9502581-Pyramimonas_sp.AAC.1